MERRTFLQSVVGLGIVASSGFLSLFTKCKPKKCLTSSYDDIKLWNVDEVDEKTQKEMMETFNSPPPSELIEKKPLKNLYENGRYNPRWNVNGSWNKVQNRIDLIYHLNGANHGFDKSYLNTLSTDELQKLHDDDHNKKRRTTTRRRWFR